jgi:hypothetical protein
MPTVLHYLMSLKLVTILAYTIALPVGVGFFYFGKLSKQFKSLVLLFAIGLAFEILSTFFRGMFRNNLIVINSYSIIEGFILLSFVGQEIKRWHRHLITGLQLLLVVIGIYETLINPNSFNLLLSTLESIFIIVVILYSIVEVANGKNITAATFWMNGVILFYFLSSTIYFVTRKYLEMDALIFVASIHVWINVICNILYAVILWKASRSKSLLLA